VFHTKDTETAIEKDKKCNPDAVNKYSRKLFGIDPGFGSSSFGQRIKIQLNHRILGAISKTQ
jgi:hypothetical protein